MRELIALSLTGSHVVLHAAIEQRATVRDDDWSSALAEVFARHRAQGARGTLNVQAQLGLDHARVAIMTVDQPGGFVSIAAAKHEALVHAWAADVLHVEPSEQVIRWRALADPRQVLVSCIGRAVAEALGAACQGADVQLVSCRPAVLSALRVAERAASDARELILVWTEAGSGARRHGVAQLLRFREGRLNAMWRGWLPPESDAHDDAFEALISRIEETSDGVPAARAKMHWPSALVT